MPCTLSAFSQSTASGLLQLTPHTQDRLFLLLPFLDFPVDEGAVIAATRAAGYLGGTRAHHLEWWVDLGRLKFNPEMEAPRGASFYCYYADTPQEHHTSTAKAISHKTKLTNISQLRSILRVTEGSSHRLTGFACQDDRCDRFARLQQWVLQAA
jgi:hypothetical protein